MSRKVRVHLIVALSAIALLLSSSAPVQAAGSQRSKTVVAKDRIGKRAESGAVVAEAIPAEQAKVVLVLKSKRVEKVDQISIAYSCNEPNASPGDAVSKAKWVSPEGGVELPVKLAVRFPKHVDSEHCSVSAGVSAPFEDGRAGSMTLKILTFGKKK